jgi:hypothetical protein
MQRCERNVFLEVCHHRFIDDHRPVVFRPAMDDPVTNGEKLQALRLAKPGRHHGDRGGNVCDFARRIGFVDQRRSIGGFGGQPRLRADTIDLTFDQAPQRARFSNAEYLKLDA